MSFQDNTSKVPKETEAVTPFEDLTHILFFGNPGSGKSTLLNCLMSAKSSTPLEEDQLFKSGVSIATGMTYELDKKEVDGVVYMDTPGLDDRKKRQQAADAITEALRQEGSYQVVFVLTLEAGRVKTADVVTMQMVLRSAPIKLFGVIFNKLEKGVYEKVTGEKELQDVLMAELATPQIGVEVNIDTLPLPLPIYVERMAQLDGKDGVVAKMAEVERLMSSLTPFKIDKEEVYDLKIEVYESRLKEVEEQMEHFRLHTEELQEMIDQQKLMYEQRINKLCHENESMSKKLSNFYPFNGLEKCIIL